MKKSLNNYSKDNKNNKQNRLERILEIPKEISSNNPKITIIGFNEMLIENYKGILEYEDYFIRVNTLIGIININGINLKLEKMTEDNLKIKGKIEKIDIERIKDD